MTRLGPWLLLCGLAATARAGTLESAKEESGLPFGEAAGLGAPRRPIAVGAAAAARPAAPRPGVRRAAREVPTPVAPRRHDGYGGPRMIALAVGGYALGIAAMATVGFANPWTLLLFVPLGAAYAVWRARQDGASARRTAVAALKGAAIGLCSGMPFAGAWAGAQASELWDRLLDRRDRRRSR